MQQFCKTSRQEAYLEHMLAGLTPHEAAQEMGITLAAARGIGLRIRREAEKHGLYADPQDESPTPPQPLFIERETRQYEHNDDGSVTRKRTWVKSKAEFTELAAQVREVVESLMDEITPTEHVELHPGVACLTEDEGSRYLLNNHIITDYHLGQLCWGEETHDQNWDTKIAEDFLVKWQAAAIRNAPVARVGVIKQLGDFLHFDGLEAKTPRSGHIVDADMRYAKMVRVAIRVLRKVVHMMLQKYPEVRLICAEGNHDLVAGPWLRESFAAFYDHEPRLTVDTNPSPFGAFQHGKCMIGYHHGHRRPMKDLDRVLAGMYPEMYGNTTMRFAHSGHLHHGERTETQLMELEMHPTMVALDTYAANHGYRSMRRAPVITYHEKYGEVNRQGMTPEMVKDLSR